MASDYKEVKNVFMYSVPQATLISRDKPVRSIADLKGMKILTPGAAFAPIIGAWGASPVPMDLNDMFNALSTGVVDAIALTPTALLPPWRLCGDIQIRHRRRVGPVQSVRRHHEQGQLCGADAARRRPRSTS